MVGAGALGNEVLKNLALLGIGTVYVIDRDSVETSNLSRSVLFRAADAGRAKAEVAITRARELNPDMVFHGKQGDILTDVGLGLFAAVDVVIGCLDNREARLWVNRQCWKVSTPWVDAGIQEIQGVVKVFVPPDSACYECAMTRRDYELLNLRYSCPLLRREDLLEGKVPTAPTIASMMAALQVQEALKLIHGLPVAAGVRPGVQRCGESVLHHPTPLPERVPEPRDVSRASECGVREPGHTSAALRRIEGPARRRLDPVAGPRSGHAAGLPAVWSRPRGLAAAVGRTDE